jgi:hypothetical protein
MRITRLLFLALVPVLLATFAVRAATPVYNQGHAVELDVGNQIKVWDAETPTPGNGTTAASEQLIFASWPNGQAGTPFHAQGVFSGNPGVFEIDVQVSDDDVDTHYQTASNAVITSVDSTNFTWHYDGTNVSTRYSRLLMRARANSVNITAWIGR